MRGSCEYTELGNYEVRALYIQSEANYEEGAVHMYAERGKL